MKANTRLYPAVCFRGEYKQVLPLSGELMVLLQEGA